LAIANSEIAGLLERMADLLEIEEANPFRVRAYRNAARTIAGLPRSVAAMVDAGEDLSELPTIGKDLAQNIEQMVETGSLPALTEIERRTPSGLVTLLNLPGLGPKRVHALHDRLGIEDLEALAAAARAGEICKLPGFSVKIEQNILRGIVTLTDSRPISAFRHAAKPLKMPMAASGESPRFRGRFV
jgi:DNA polymerase (family 10)